jgi:predicted AAA+ superfamily ATPase
LGEPDVMEREIRAITKSADYLKIHNAVIVTRDEEMDIEKDGVHIQILPVWKWLLSAPL